MQMRDQLRHHGQLTPRDWSLYYVRPHLWEVAAETSDVRTLKLRAFTWKRRAYGYAGMRAD